MILSGGWTSTSYGFQLAIDNDPNYFMALRQRNGGGWFAWKRIPMGDGTGASGTWAINISGNAATATSATSATSAGKLTTDAGGTTQPVYFTGGVPTTTSYALKATVNDGTASNIAYYSSARAISSTSLISFDTTNSIITLGSKSYYYQRGARGAVHHEFLGYDDDYGVMKIRHLHSDGHGGPGSYTATLAVIDERIDNISGAYEPTFFINRSGATRVPDLMGVNVGGTRVFTIKSNGSALISGNTIWHAGNDGTNSGLDADLLDGNHASAFALAGHDHNSTYVKRSGDDVTGHFTFRGRIFGYNYNNQGSNAPAFIFDKPGSNYTGIGCHSSTSLIWFGACSPDGTWVDDFKQSWQFNGTVISDGYKKSGSSDSNVLLGGGGDAAISGLSVNYATSAGSASSAGDSDKLDGYHASSFLFLSGGRTTGAITATTATPGSTTIDKVLDAIIIGPGQSRGTSSGIYYPGIGFNHMINYNNGTGYDYTTQAWIGLKLYDTPGSERSSLVFATKSGTDHERPVERASIDPFGNFYVTGAITAGSASDIRLKRDIQILEVEKTIDVLERLNPITFSWNSKAIELNRELTDAPREAGFIAQEVLEILPEAVRKDLYDKQYYRLDKDKLIAYLVKGWQIHEKEIKELKEKLK